MTEFRIPIMKPTLPPFESVKDDFERIFSTCQLTLGPYVVQFELKAAQYLGVKHAIGAPSGTSGLIVLFSVLPRGSEVILPAYTFSATYQALRWNSLKAVPVDCDDRCNVDPDEVRKAITPRTKAIVAVHVFGHPPEIDELESIAKKANIPLYFDAAHAFGGEWKGRKLGGFGAAEVFSLGPTKTMPTGEGGLITTNDDALAERMRLACNHGHPPGSLDCFCDGMNARLQEINAVIGVRLLDTLEKWIARRNELADLYERLLAGIPGISWTTRASYVRSTVKDYAIFVDPSKYGKDRDRLADELEARGIMTKKYYWPPIHRLAYALEEFKNVHCPKTELLSSRTLSLPLYSHMPIDYVKEVAAAIKEIQRI
ncbi:MAG: DegT/DnrJ/EryC1/StrS family aminotransferase [Candidatus Eisenbacteria bacterium]|nr:DegT/DnrJ/EryC1/StrS family aminotransferase [Candidatus Eisenbacteria bacterium]